MRTSKLRTWTSSPALAAPRWSLSSLLGFLLAGALLTGSWHIAEIEPALLIGAQGRRQIWLFLSGLFPPDLSPAFLSLLLHPALETLQISIMGTVLAIFLGFPLALLATNRLSFAGVLYEMDGPLSPWRRAARRMVYLTARMLLNLCRSIPEIVWALMFVRVVGLGPFAGVLAIGMSYGGMLGKIYAEILESSPEGPIEALHAAGAGKLTLLGYGFLPQAFANIASYSLYRWECAIRSAAILGLVGAGGLGQQIEISMRMFRYQETSTIILIVFMLVTVVDHLSTRIRRAL
ncbi:MAG: phosphonate ABC transporter, permease protein PhnE [Nitrospinae bacterium]|nr:phosphonate ABC transporter, permease protein PhnE [Nitrospinota bacterium]